MSYRGGYRGYYAGGENSGGGGRGFHLQQDGTRSNASAGFRDGRGFSSQQDEGGFSASASRGYRGGGFRGDGNSGSRGFSSQQDDSHSDSNAGRGYRGGSRGFSSQQDDSHSDSNAGRGYRGGGGRGFSSQQDDGADRGSRGGFRGDGYGGGRGFSSQQDDSRSDSNAGRGYRGGGRGFSSQQDDGAGRGSRGGFRGDLNGGGRGFSSQQSEGRFNVGGGAGEQRDTAYTDTEKVLLSDWDSTPITKPSPFTAFKKSSLYEPIKNPEPAVKESDVQTIPVKSLDLVAKEDDVQTIPVENPEPAIKECDIKTCAVNVDEINVEAMAKVHMEPTLDKTNIELEQVDTSDKVADVVIESNKEIQEVESTDVVDTIVIAAADLRSENVQIDQENALEPAASATEDKTTSDAKETSVPEAPTNLSTVNIATAMDAPVSADNFVFTQDIWNELADIVAEISASFAKLNDFGQRHRH